MPYTLADQVQAMGDYEKGVVKLIFDDMAGGAQNLLKVIPIGDVDRLVNTYLTSVNEGPTTGIGSRTINGPYPEGTSSLTQRGFTIGNVGGRAMVDEIFMIQKGYASGANPMDKQIADKTKLLNRNVNNGIINGDRTTDPNYFNGFKRWLLAKNTLSMAQINSTAYTAAPASLAGAATSADQKAALEAIFYLLSLVGGAEDPNVYLVCNWQAQRTINKAIRELGWFGTANPYFDKSVQEFAGVKFLNPGAKIAQTTFFDAIQDANAVIGNNFSYPGAGGAATEVWAVRFGLDDGVSLQQMRPLKVTDLGRMQQAPVYVTEIDWHVGLYAANDYSIAKLTGLKCV